MKGRSVIVQAILCLLILADEPGFLELMIDLTGYNIMYFRV